MSFGIGPKLLSLDISGVNVRLCIIPLGGYIKLDNEKLKSISPLKFLMIAISGPASNLLSIIIGLFVVVFFQSDYVYKADMTRTIFSEGKFSSKSETIYFLDKTPILNHYLPTKVDSIGELQMKDSEIYYIQLSHKELTELTNLNNYKNLGPGERIKLTLLASKNLLAFTSDAVQSSLKTATSSLKEVSSSFSSVISLTKNATKAVHSSSYDYLEILFALSFSLFLFNMIPLAMFDGGQAVIALYRHFLKSEPNPIFLKGYNQISIAILILIAVIGVFNDLN